MATPNIQNEPGAVEGFDSNAWTDEERAAKVAAYREAHDPDADREDLVAQVIATFEGAEPGRYLADGFDADGTEAGPVVIVVDADGTQRRGALVPEDEPYLEAAHAPEEAVRLPDVALTAAERRARRGPREPKAPRLRRDLFGSAGGLK